MSTPPSFFAALSATPDTPASKLSRYTMWNGVLYLLLGGALFVLPGGVHQAIMGVAADQVGNVRLVGMCVGIIGWFYVMGARTGATSFGLATVVDRAAVPFLLGALVVAGEVTLQQVIAFAVLDPLLALGAFLIWRAER